MNKIVWVTGAFGFIGRHLCKSLNEAGYSVAGIGHGNWADWDSQGSSAWGLDHQKAESIGFPQRSSLEMVSATIPIGSLTNK